MYVHSLLPKGGLSDVFHMQYSIRMHRLKTSALLSGVCLIDIKKRRKSWDISIKHLRFNETTNPIRMLPWFQCVFQSSCGRNLIPNATLLRSGTFKRWLGCADRMPKNGLMLLWPPYIGWDQCPSLSHAPILLSFHLPPWNDTERRPSPDVGPLDLAFTTSRTLRNKSLFFINSSTLLQLHKTD